MSIIGSILSATPLGSIFTSIGNVVDEVFTSDEERLKAAYLMEKLRQEPYLIQAQTNLAEASHKSLFVAGWRPFIGWVCGFGLLFTFLIVPIMQYFGLATPVIPTDVMYNMVLSLLGLGGMRTYEKLRGVESNSMKKEERDK